MIDENVLSVYRLYYLKSKQYSLHNIHLVYHEVEDSFLLLHVFIYRRYFF